MPIHKINIETILEKTNIINHKLQNTDSISSEIRIRIKDINNSLQKVVNDLNELDIEFYRDRKLVSNKAQQIIEENEKRDCIINHFLPSMTLFSVMREDLKKNATIGDNIRNNTTKISESGTDSIQNDFNEYLKTKFTT